MSNFTLKSKCRDLKIIYCIHAFSSTSVSKVHLNNGLGTKKIKTDTHKAKKYGRKQKQCFGGYKSKWDLN